MSDLARNTIQTSLPECATGTNNPPSVKKLIFLSKHYRFSQGCLLYSSRLLFEVPSIFIGNVLPMRVL